MSDVLLQYYLSDSYYLTIETIGRESVIVGSVLNHLLRAVLTEVKAIHPFTTLGYVFLPDHLHLLTKPEGKSKLDQIVGAIVERYGRQYADLMGQPRPQPIWQRDYRAQRIKEIDEFAELLDWLHANPVYHKWVELPTQWPYSSYQTWIERGLYQVNEPIVIPNHVLRKKWG